jgi:hypothetical protein
MRGAGAGVLPSRRHDSCTFERAPVAPMAWAVHAAMRGTARVSVQAVRDAVSAAALGVAPNPPPRGEAREHRSAPPRAARRQLFLPMASFRMASTFVRRFMHSLRVWLEHRWWVHGTARPSMDWSGATAWQRQPLRAAPTSAVATMPPQPPTTHLNLSNWRMHRGQQQQSTRHDAAFSCGQSTAAVTALGSSDPRRWRLQRGQQAGSAGSPAACRLPHRCRHVRQSRCQTPAGGRACCARAGESGECTRVCMLPAGPSCAPTHTTPTTNSSLQMPCLNTRSKTQSPVHVGVSSACCGGAMVLW